METQGRISLALLALRMGVFMVMLMWTLDKFVNPAHAQQVYAHFYFLDGLGPTAFLVIGLLELLLLIGFVGGYQKRLTYGAVFCFHAVSTLSTFRLYLDPFNNLLFLAAWPMLAACFALYLLRDLDTRLVIEGGQR